MIKISPPILLLLALTSLILTESHDIYPDTDVVRYLCSNTSFDHNSSYEDNLITLLSTLSSNSKQSTSNGYYATNISDPEIIYGAYICRGDVPSKECSECVSLATKNMPPIQCPADKKAVIWYNKCMVRYSNVSFLGIVDETFQLPFKNPENVTSDAQAYMDKAGDILESLAKQMSNPNSTMTGDKRYFETQVDQLNKDSIISLYTMVECTPDLAPGDCVRCLQIIINEIPTSCGIRKGCRMLNPSCYARYEAYIFSELPISPSSSLSPLPTSYVTSVESLQYDLATLEVATNSFSDDNKIGEGGFGGVYKGTLQNGVEIAVKRLSKGSNQGLEQFKNEVLLIAKHQHRNLVKLLGFCLTSNEMLLVYEFACNKSLDLILFDSNRRRRLGWSARYKIINGIARGLSYLHEDSRRRIIHCDLKASNILLDANMNPKISDFGQARNFHENQDQAHTARLTGTIGYMAPEYIDYGEISTKSDVYSFGVLVLEIISGKKIGNRHTGLIENLLLYAWKQWNEDTIATFVDECMEDAYSSEEVKRCIHLGLLCVQGETEQRPSMIKVVTYLNSNVDLPAPQQPTIVSSNVGFSLGASELHSDWSHKSRASTSISRASTSMSQTNISAGR